MSSVTEKDLAGLSKNEISKLKRTALDIATKYYEPAHKVIERAELYLKFLVSNEEDGE